MTMQSADSCQSLGRGLLKRLLSLLLAMIAATAAQADDAEIAALFADAGVQGTLVLARLDGQEIIEHRLPDRPKTCAGLREIMLAEEGDDFRLYAETGWATRNQPQIGWYIG